MLALLAAAWPAQAQDAEGIIVFSSYRETTTYDLYSIRPDRTQERQLFATDASDHSPAISPDGGTVLFSSDTFDYVSIAETDIAGGGVRPFLRDASTYGTPAWSRDGTTVAFASTRDAAEPEIAFQDLEIYVAGAGGDDIRRITDAPGNNYDPSFSPDGSRIAFYSDRPGTHGLYVVDADADMPGAGQLLVAGNGSSGLDWHPFEDKIVYTCGTGQSLCLVESDGTPLTPIFLFGTGVEYAIGPSWSPDGQYVAFTCRFFGGDLSNGLEICIIRPDGSGFRRLTDNDFLDASPSWGVTTPKLRATLLVEPPQVERGGFVTARLRITNAGSEILHDVTGDVAVSNANLTLLSSPQTDTAPTLLPSESFELVFEYFARHAGVVELSGHASAQDLEGAPVTAKADVRCPSPGDGAALQAGSASGQDEQTPTCSPDAAVVKIVHPDFRLEHELEDFVYAPGTQIELVEEISNRAKHETFTEIEASVRVFAADAEENATATVTSTEPSPPHVAQIGPLDGTEIKFMLDVGLHDSEEPGLLGVEVIVTGKTSTGERVRAKTSCPAGAREPVADGEPGCDLETGILYLRVAGGCDVSILDASPPITVYRADAHVTRTDTGAIVACGGGNALCTVIKDPGDYASRVSPVSVSAGGSTKNVGQEVVLEASVLLPEGKTEADIKTIRWIVQGATITSYQDFSAFRRGMAGTFLFKANQETTSRIVTKKREPAAGEVDSDWNRLWFFWKSPGEHFVQATVTIEGGQAPDITCSKELRFTVERNRDDPDRQPEKLYAGCCEKALDPDLQALDGLGQAIDGFARVGRMHEQLHAEDDAQPAFPGESWIGFHRVIVDSFNAWRAFFGYPAVGMWDGAVPIPKQENGYDTTDPSRFTDAPQCGQTFAPPEALCPLPPWFTREGATDGEGAPIMRPMEPVAGGDTCQDEGGMPVGIGQATIDDFATDRALGCILAKTWHSNLHFLISGAMASTASSPWDPVFWRLHTYLSGAEIGGEPGLFAHQAAAGTHASGSDHGSAGAVSAAGPASSLKERASRSRGTVTEPGPVPVYLAWELAKAQGAPGVSVHLPKAATPVAALPTVVVQFWEDVTGVDAADVLVAGSPATDVDVVHVDFTEQDGGRDYHLFTGFAEPPLGDVTIQVLPGGIEDEDGNDFTGFEWIVRVEEDGDGDGIADSIDNCPDVANPTQINTDRPMFFPHQYDDGSHHHGHDDVGDDLGDACDEDDDDDGIGDEVEEEGFGDPLDPSDVDLCPDDDTKGEPGHCGCGTPDVDSDGDDIVDCTDECPLEAADFLAPCLEACPAATCRDVDEVCKRCGQPLTDGELPKASDALLVLRTAVGSAQCTPCVCDVNASGSVTATDALATLRKAVGSDLMLSCPML
ncbi:MAG TPA: hypothetical protein VEC57_13075 [Candidatus Limnocylindrales bacterium]|nr:hypothetical protein [Candidatus Limnocylindrales bacterium]